MSTPTIFYADKTEPRLDRFVAAQVPDISRGYARELIERGLIRVNGKPSKPSKGLAAGDRVEVIVPPGEEGRDSPGGTSLDIIYEDEDVMVVDKPAGLTCHPAPGHPGGTLTDALVAYYPPLAQVGERSRPGLVHRLDRDTSGLIIIAKNEGARCNLASQFHRRSVFKEYLALVEGHLKPEHGFIEAPLTRGTGDRRRMVIAKKGREATTEYRVVGYSPSSSLLLVHPLTGRTHQIRVHLGAIGHPVVGDATYGNPSDILRRQFLHAYKIGFQLPSSNQYVEFISPLPPELAQVLIRLGLPTEGFNVKGESNE